MTHYDDPQYQPPDGDLDVPEQPLAQDYGTPAAPPEEGDDETGANNLPIDHPDFDDGLDEHQVYDEGQTNASEANAQHLDDEGSGNVA
jgi:hypothetical protein